MIRTAPSSIDHPSIGRGESELMESNFISELAWIGDHIDWR